MTNYEVGELHMVHANVVSVATLDFARGHVGERFPLTTDQQKAEFAANSAARTFELTQSNTADCMDERVTIGFANGNTDQAYIASRIVPQLPGGEGLAATKAAIAANAAIIKDAPDIWQAYEIVMDFLAANGEEDAAHDDCGAERSAQSSVVNQIPQDVLLPAVGLIVPHMNNDPWHQKELQAMSTHKRHRLESGFYDVWEPTKHSQYVIDRFPQNYSHLKIDHDDLLTHGHNGSGLYATSRDGHGYQKDGTTFSITIPKMRQLAVMLGGSSEERERIFIGFADDALHVSAGIVTSEFPVFAEAA
jgi:hypothetical protein